MGIKNIMITCEKLLQRAKAAYPELYGIGKPAGVGGGLLGLKRWLEREDPKGEKHTVEYDNK